jgi:2-polyprenyl-3-methyl-5-hydroxy-6-metoxy-1,4-benzoquinol methylase
VWKDSASHLSSAAERERYALHTNTLADTGYVSWMGQMVEVVRTLAPAGAEVLDFGCGEHQVLCRLLDNEGFCATPYDPLYGSGVTALAQSYAVVVASEVVEHLRSPAAEFLRLRGCVRAGGSVVVRTRLYPQQEHFAQWWYGMDATHLCFYSLRTLAYCAELLGGAMRRFAEDIFVIGPCAGQAVVQGQ